MQIHGFCPKCCNMRFLEKHHTYPKRFFGKKNNNCKLFICGDCHKEIERILPQFTKLTKEEYRNIHKGWLLGKEPFVFLP